MTHTRKIRETVILDTFFKNNNVPEIAEYIHHLDYDVKVNTPYGYYSIPSICRTDTQISIRLYFTNNKTLECGWGHKLKVNGEWKLVRDIDIKNDIIETEIGTTKIRRIKEGKSKILYDLMVDKVQCFYANSILSHNTWILCAIGVDAIRSGLNVVHYTMELSEHYVGQRYDTVHTQIPTNKLRDNLKVVKSKVESIKGNLIIKYFPPKSISTRHIEHHIEKMTVVGNKPDLIIIDYADLMLSHSNRVDSTYAEQGGVYIELRGLSGELGIPIWSAAQSNRDSISAEIIEADKIADSYAKVMNADFIMSWSRKSADKLNNTARAHIMKNRFGPDGLTFPCKMDTNIGFIEVYDSNSPDGILSSKAALNGKVEQRDILRKKYLEQIG